MADGMTATGTVLWFSARKGFGFIKPDMPGPDLFVHVSDVSAAGLETLAEGDRLAYEPVPQGDGRWYAHQLKLLAGGQGAPVD
jgi:cold shock protein